MSLKNKIDRKSIRFKLWAYFSGFALILILLIWGLQIFFLETSYEEMKKEEVSKLANQIVRSYELYNGDLYQLTDKLNDLTTLNEDFYISVETLVGEPIVTPSYSGLGPLYRYNYQIDQLRRSLLSNRDMPFVTMISRNTGMETNAGVMGYACYLDQNSIREEFPPSAASSNYILYVISPLYPVQSTVSIMKGQLINTTIIATILALILAMYLARRISKPIKDITQSAAEMGKGNYGVQFNGGHYTEIIDLADTLTIASRELEKTDMYQKDLIANVSHDLRTPLTMIKSYAEMIRDLSGNNPEKREAHLNVIIEETDRLNTLVTDMLNMSRLQNRTIVLEYTDFDIVETAETLLTSYDLLCEQEGYKIIFQGTGPFMVNGDETKIKQVFSNLINNAVKYCGEDKEIIVNLRKTGRNKVRCEVIDHGKGIAPDELTRVWERYYKSSTHHVRQTEGSGLGLSIVKEILSLHKASYGVKSKEGEGSTFWFEMELIKPKK
ncbi:MAG: sensor histidine kinase [Firmicutes bacterium]|nr:sensor histidine kinase [Bacillota bacterium]